MRKGELLLVKLRDHSLIPKGEPKDTDVVILNVIGRVYSARGKQLILETWWSDNKGFEHNHEWAKIMKADIVGIIKLKELR